MLARILLGSRVVAGANGSEKENFLDSFEE